MDIVNGDGSKASMCGNGARCFATFVLDVVGLTTARRFNVMIPAAPDPTGATRAPRIVVLDAMTPGSVSVEIGPATVELDLAGVIALPVTFVEHVGTSVHVVGVQLGNPHCVLVLPPNTDLGSLDVPAVGRAIGTSTAWSPDGCNVGFVSVADGKTAGTHVLNLRVWERGCGETLSCGSGSCAAYAACVGRDALPTPSDGVAIDVVMPGGALSVSMVAGSLHLRGPTELVFVGQLSVPDEAAYRGQLAKAGGASATVKPSVSDETPRQC
jgi:diaminopimelate epimerase